jgi:hypothetical protein
MTDPIDRMIDEALDAEERELLRQIGDEPGYFTQIWGLFDGRLGWVSWLMMFWQTAMFITAVYCAVQFFQASEALEALRWGMPSAVLLIMAGMLKLALWPSLQTNRVLRELKRVELQIARTNAKG